jgi:hypothetical protein
MARTANASAGKREILAVPITAPVKMQAFPQINSGLACACY